MKKAVIAVALGCCAGIVQANQGPQWDGVSFSYASADFLGETLTGFGVSGTKLVNENVFLAGAYSSISGDMPVYGQSADVELNELSLGLGFRHPLTPETDFYGIVSYEDIEAKVGYMGNSGSASENGYGLRAGIRSMVADKIELSAGLAHVSDGDESDNYFMFGASYFLTNQFSLGLGYSSSSDVDTTSLSASFYF